MTHSDDACNSPRNKQFIVGASIMLPQPLHEHVHLLYPASLPRPSHRPPATNDPRLLPPPAARKCSCNCFLSCRGGHLPGGWGCAGLLPGQEGGGQQGVVRDDKHVGDRGTSAVVWLCTIQSVISLNRINIILMGFKNICSCLFGSLAPAALCDTTF
jgi:hypothetical protein